MVAKVALAGDRWARSSVSTGPSGNSLTVEPFSFFGHADGPR